MECLSFCSTPKNVDSTVKTHKRIDELMKVLKQKKYQFSLYSILKCYTSQEIITINFKVLIYRYNDLLNARNNMHKDPSEILVKKSVIIKEMSDLYYSLPEDEIKNCELSKCIEMIMNCSNKILLSETIEIEGICTLFKNDYAKIIPSLTELSIKLKKVMSVTDVDIISVDDIIDGLVNCKDILYWSSKTMLYLIPHLIGKNPLEINNVNSIIYKEAFLEKENEK